jgi:prevent-host-death family protein
MSTPKKRSIDLSPETSFPRMGKAKARRELLPLVDAIAAGSTPVEITDNGKPVAVIIGYTAFQEMCGKLTSKTAKHKLESLDGSVTILGNLEQARRQIEQETANSTKRRSKLL